MLKLEFPHESHREMYETLKETWKDYELSRVSARMFQYKNYEEFLEAMRWDFQWPQWRVPSTFFFSIEDNAIVWHIQVRHHIDHPNLRDVWWHIGYGVVPWKWWKWLGKKQLELALIESQNLWLKKVMISCLEENIASAKVIESNGWKLEQVRILDNPPEDMKDEIWKNLKIYWIDL